KNSLTSQSLVLPRRAGQEDHSGQSWTAQSGEIQLETHTKQAVLDPRWDGRESASNRKIGVRCILLILMAAVAFTAILRAQMQQARSAAIGAALTNCGAPTVITLSQLESLSTNKIIPDK